MLTRRARIEDAIFSRQLCKPQDPRRWSRRGRVSIESNKLLTLDTQHHFAQPHPRSSLSAFTVDRNTVELTRNPVGKYPGIQVPSRAGA